MAAAINIWTPCRDSRLRRMRQEGASWETIAEALRVDPADAARRGRQIGAWLSPAGLAASEDPARDPLPAGHPRAWTELTAGTWLAGTCYPAPGDEGRRV
jgi:hypothetical protein